MMLLKCCTQNDSKFGKLSSGHRTEKRLVFFFFFFATVFSSEGSPSAQLALKEYEMKLHLLEGGVFPNIV